MVGQTRSLASGGLGSQEVADARTSPDAHLRRLRGGRAPLRRHRAGRDVTLATGGL